MKIGDRFTISGGVTLEIRPNLVQILTGKDSCVGCYFLGEDRDCFANASIPDCSGACFPKEEQFIYVEVTTDESG